MSCNDSSFSGGNKKKDPAPANLNDPNNTSDANPNLEPGKSDCTNLDEQACKDKKKSDGNDKSFRTVDCTDKTAADCSKAVADDIKKDGDNKSDIIVKGCAENKDNECSKIKDDYGKDGRDVKIMSEQNGETIGDDGSGSPKGGLGEGDGAGTKKTGDISEGEGDTLKNNAGYLCLGGPGGRITVAKRTDAEASTCMRQANSKPCANDPKCGSEYHLQLHKCKCSKPTGIDYSRPCLRTNPLKAGAATVISECHLD
jgi:hypothetical protein